MSENTPHKRRWFGRRSEPRQARSAVKKPKLHRYQAYLHHPFEPEEMAGVPVQQIEDFGQEIAVTITAFARSLGIRTVAIGAECEQGRISGWACVMLPGDAAAMELMDLLNTQLACEHMVAEVKPLDPLT